MNQTIVSLATMAALAAGAPSVFSAPFEARDVAAAPALLVHVDCDAIRNSSIGKSVLSNQEVQDKLAALGAIFDFDIRKQLHGFTIYTTEEHPKDGALIVYADFDPNRLITLAKAADGFEALTNGSNVIYSWLDDKKKSSNGETPRVYGAIAGHRVVFGQNESHLANALDVIGGSSPSFSGKKGLPRAKDDESILVEGMLLKFDFDSSDEKAAIFKKAKSVRLKVAEVGSNMTATVHLQAIDDATANEISSIAQGLLAVIKLQANDAEAKDIANAVVIKQDGATVGLTVSVPSSELSDDLVKKIKEGQKKKEHEDAPSTPAPQNK